MIAPKDDDKTIRRDQALFPKSKRVYIKGTVHPDLEAIHSGGSRLSRIHHLIRD